VDDRPTTVNTSNATALGLSPDQTWAALINLFPNNSAYQNTDQAFIDSWDQAIDAAESLFTGITLFLGPDAGQDFPNFSQTITPHSDNTLFAQDCSSTPNSAIMSCEAKTEILAYFLKVTGPNGKGTQVGGMNASSRLTPGNIGIAGVKVLTGLTPPPAVPLIGGAEFDHAVSDPTCCSCRLPDPGVAAALVTPEGVQHSRHSSTTPPPPSTADR
jgi:hypothetical protein